MADIFNFFLEFIDLIVWQQEENAMSLIRINFWLTVSTESKQINQQIITFSDKL